MPLVLFIHHLILASLWRDRWKFRCCHRWWHACRFRPARPDITNVPSLAFCTRAHCAIHRSGVVEDKVTCHANLLGRYAEIKIESLHAWRSASTAHSGLWCSHTHTHHNHKRPDVARMSRPRQGRGKSTARTRCFRLSQPISASVVQFLKSSFQNP